MKEEYDAIPTKVLHYQHQNEAPTKGKAKSDESSSATDPRNWCVGIDVGGYQIGLRPLFTRRSRPYAGGYDALR